MDAFPYNVLDPFKSEIRLLHLSPDSGADAICDCMLVHSVLDDDLREQYETISYFWGDPSRIAKIRINGELILVPANTERALRRMRLSDRTRILWIDAICINQPDLVEKTHQVLLIRSVYRFSTGNLVYLGEDDSTSDRAIANIIELDQEITEESAGFRSLEDMILPDGVFVKASARMRGNIDVDALVPFFSRPWFRRVWIVQEVVLAPDNTCVFAHRDIRLSLILRVAAWLYHFHAFHIPRILYIVPGLQTASALWEQVSNKRRLNRLSKSFTALLAKTSRLKASEPRDKIFSLLGMLDLPGGVVPDLIKPDYSKDVSTVYRDATRYSIQTQRHMYILEALSHRSEADLNGEFPSWVPRFDIDEDEPPTNLGTSYRNFRRNWDTRDSELAQVHGEDLDVLVLKGVVLDRIEQVGPIISEEDTQEFWTTVLGMIKLREEYKVRFARCLTAETNYRHERSSKQDLDNIDAWLAYFIDSPPGKTLSGIAGMKDSTEESIKNAKYFHQAMLNAMKHRRWATTTAGLMGVVPKVSKQGDIFALTREADTPYVLRAVGNEYRLLGEAYLENNMDNQAFEEGRATSEIVFIVR